MSYDNAQDVVRLNRGQWVDGLLFLDWLNNFNESSSYNSVKAKLMDQYEAINKTAPFNTTARFSEKFPDKRFYFLQHPVTATNLQKIFNYLNDRDRTTELVSIQGTDTNSPAKTRSHLDAKLSALMAVKSLTDAFFKKRDTDAALEGCFDQSTFESNFGLTWTGAPAGVTARANAPAATNP